MFLENIAYTNHKQRKKQMRNVIFFPNFQFKFAE